MKSRHIASGAHVSDQSKTKRLRGYLDAQKKAVLVGAPPTKTTATLSSLLDEKSKKKRALTKNKETKGANKSISVKRIKVSTNASIKKPQSENSKSAWSRVNLGDKRIEKSHAVASATTLDDLLAPMRPKSAQQKRHSGRKSKNTERKKNAKSIAGVKSRFNASNSSHAKEVIKETSILPSRMVLNLAGGKRSMSKTHKKIPMKSAPYLASKSLKAEVSRIATSTPEVVDLPPIISMSSKTEVREGDPLDSNISQAPNNQSPVAKPLHEENIIPSPKSFAQKSTFVEPMPKQVPISEGTFTNLINTNPTMNKAKPSRSKKINNDNFVRLNMKNTAGACKGARNLKQQNRWKRKRAEWKQKNNLLGVEEFEASQPTQNVRRKGRKTTSINSAIDHLDDFLDGTFRTRPKKEDDVSKKEVASKHTLCPRHQRPCKLLTVKKNTSGNKGRKFYACSLPQGEQCDFFQWQDDTVEAAQRELLHSSSNTGFIARQVAAHVDRLKTLTLPELRLEAKKRNLLHTGKKKSVLFRLSVWVRDEVSNAVGNEDTNNGEDTNEHEVQNDDRLDLSSDDELALTDRISNNSEDDSDINSSSEDELEFTTDEGQCFKESEIRTKAIDFSEDQPKSPLHKCLKDFFGHTEFRTGQEWAIRRCLSGNKSLLVAPTGQGKSLCYALPAVLMDGLCIVVSPLVSLMEDQLRHLPPSIPAATLSGNMTAKKMAAIIDDLLRKRLRILFVSPERLASAAFRRLLRPKYNVETKTYQRELPEVSLLCVDEAHCLSQWGHNFRVSYLRLRNLLSKLNPQSVLALTATAGVPVINDICHTLHIPQCKSNDKVIPVTDNDKYSPTENDNGTHVLSSNRDNIDVAVSFTNSEEERLNILLKLLRPRVTEDAKPSDTFDKNTHDILSSGSIIIYVWRQKDALVVAEQLKGFDIPGGIVCYHGGMDSGSRTKSQGMFMRGKARICVATVAFGLGINKADVRGVVHLCLPPSPEHYLQEIGRAGRDGNPAKAIALVLENEAPHKLSLSYSDRISRGQIYTLLLNIKYLAAEDLSTADDSREAPIPLHLDLALPITPIVQATGCKEESIQTILSILEDVSPFSEKLLDIEGIIPDIAIVTLKKRSLDKLALQEEIAKSIQTCGKNIDQPQNNLKEDERKSGHDHFSQYGGTARQKGFSAYSFGVFEFSVVKAARMLGPHAEPRHVYAALRRLQNCGELELTFNDVGRSIHLRMNQEGLKYFRDVESTDNHLSELSFKLLNHFEAQDERRAEKVLGIHNIFRKIADVQEDTDAKKSKSKSKRLQLFQDLIQDHFDGERTPDEVISINECLDIDVKKVDESEPSIQVGISMDVNVLLQHPSLKKNISGFPHSMKFGEASHEDYTSLVITKILHGIETPRTPVLDWFRNPLWGKWRSIHFHSLKLYVESLL